MDYQNGDLSLGLAVTAFFTDENRQYARNLTEAEKEEMIFRREDAKLKQESDRGFLDIRDKEDMRDILRGPGIG